MQRITGAIFDMDGTLLDSMHIWKSVGSDYLRSIGVEPEPDFDERVIRMSLLDAAEYMRSQYGVLGGTQEIIDGANEQVAQKYLETLGLKPGAVQLLETLQARGVRMCVATNTDKRLALAALERNGVLGYFVDVFTCGEVGVGKDRPDIYEHALACLGTQKAETLVFEDAVHAIETAQAAGFPVAAVYDPSEEGNQDKIRVMADYYLEALTKYPEVLPLG